ncbi:MAG: hypothetical protein AAB421_04275 [Patescibacteria group bacterium]
MNGKYALVGGAICAVIAGGVAFWFVQGGATALDEKKISVTGASFTPKIENADIVAPKVPRKLVFPDYMQKDARKKVTDNINKLADAIHANPEEVSSWLDLALQYKVIDDFEGARETWEYLVAAAPKNAVSIYNLGYLYHFSLKDFPKAEEYFKKAIEIDPVQELYYMALHELYRYSYKQNTTLAVDTLLAGIKQSPKSINLPLALAAYYRDDKKDKVNTLKYFVMARDNAKEAANIQALEMLEKEIKLLQK